MKPKRALSNIYIALIMLFLYAPMLVMVVFSFNGTSSTGVLDGFSTKWYGELLKDSVTLQALSNTLILAVTSSLIAMVLGTAAAVGIHSMKKKWIKTSVLTVTNIPMVNPEIVTGVSMMLLFVFAGQVVGKSDVLGFPTLLMLRSACHMSFFLYCRSCGKRIDIWAKPRRISAVRRLRHFLK